MRLWGFGVSQLAIMDVRESASQDIVSGTLGVSCAQLEIWVVTALWLQKRVWAACPLRAAPLRPECDALTRFQA